MSVQDIVQKFSQHTESELKSLVSVERTTSLDMFVTKFFNIHVIREIYPMQQRISVEEPEIEDVKTKHHNECILTVMEFPKNWQNH